MKLGFSINIGPMTSSVETDASVKFKESKHKKDDETTDAYLQSMHEARAIGDRALEKYWYGEYLKYKGYNPIQRIFMAF